MAGESLKKKYQDYLVQQVFGTGTKYVLAQESAAERNIEEAKVEPLTHVISEEPTRLGKTDAYVVTEENAEDGSWIVFNKVTADDGDAKHEEKEEAGESSTEVVDIQRNAERSYYMSLDLIPGKVPH